MFHIFVDSAGTKFGGVGKDMFLMAYLYKIVIIYKECYICRPSPSTPKFGRIGNILVFDGMLGALVQVYPNPPPTLGPVNIR